MVEEKNRRVLISGDGKKKFSKHQFMMMQNLMEKFCENFCPFYNTMGCDCPVTLTFDDVVKAKNPAHSAGPVSRRRKLLGEVIHPAPGPAGAKSKEVKSDD
ncbi:hypothetical protein ES703_108758 [subsurface metagenome]